MLLSTLFSLYFNEVFTLFTELGYFRKNNNYLIVGVGLYHSLKSKWKYIFDSFFPSFLLQFQEINSLWFPEILHWCLKNCSSFLQIRCLYFVFSFEMKTDSMSEYYNEGWVLGEKTEVVYLPAQNQR